MINQRVVVRFVCALCALALLFTPSWLFAQHTHSHSDNAVTSQDMSAMDMRAADWKMEAMAEHMAYSSPRPLTSADSIRAGHVINELRQAIAKYQDVKAAE